MTITNIFTPTTDDTQQPAVNMTCAHLVRVSLTGTSQLHILVIPYVSPEILHDHNPTVMSTQVEDQSDIITRSTITTSSNNNNGGKPHNAASEYEKLIGAVPTWPGAARLGRGNSFLGSALAGFDSTTTLKKRFFA